MFLILLKRKLILAQFLEVLLVFKLFTHLEFIPLLIQILTLAPALLLKLVPIQAQVPLLFLPLTLIPTFALSLLLELFLIMSLALVVAQSHFGKHLDPGFPSKILGLATQSILPLALVLFFPALEFTDQASFIRQVAL